MKKLSRAFAGMFILGFISFSHIITGCGSAGSAPAASTCSALSVPGFYSSFTLTGSANGTTVDIVKNYVTAIYLNLTNDGKLTGYLIEPDPSATSAQAAGTAFIKSSISGNWTLQNNDISLVVTDSENHTFTLSGQASQSAYPNCFVSLNISGNAQVPVNEHSSNGILAMVAYQTPTDFSATTFSGTFNLESSNGILNSNSQEVSSGLPLMPAQYIITANNSTSGTYSATINSTTITGPFTLNNPILNITFNTDHGSESIDEYILFNPTTNELISLVYGITDQQNEVTSTYQMFKKE